MFLSHYSKKVITIVVIMRTRIGCFVSQFRAHRISSDAKITVVYLTHGIAMEIKIALKAKTNHKDNANTAISLVLRSFSNAI